MWADVSKHLLKVDEPFRNHKRKPLSMQIQLVRRDSIWFCQYNEKTSEYYYIYLLLFSYCDDYFIGLIENHNMSYRYGQWN